MAKQIPGTVPVLTPLQPAPVGVKPDISRNTNNVTNEAVLPEGVTVQQQQDGRAAVVTAPDQTGVFAGLSGPAGPAAATQWVWVLTIIIIVAIGLLVLWRYSAGKKGAGRKTEGVE